MFQFASPLELTPPSVTNLLVLVTEYTEHDLYSLQENDPFEGIE